MGTGEKAIGHREWRHRIKTQNKVKQARHFTCFIKNLLVVCFSCIKIKYNCIKKFI